MKKTLNDLNRRDFIRNTAGGVASASMVNAFVQRAMAESDTTFKRCIVWYVPEGAAQQAFWPAQTGNLVINQNASINGKNPASNGTSIRGYVNASMAGYCLQPLNKHRGDISLYSGFKNNGGGASDPHAEVVNTALTGGTGNGGSLDQILGRALKGTSPIASIYMPIYGHHTKNNGASHTYMSPVRRIGGGTTGSANWNPMETYNQLFPNGVPTGGGGGGPTRPTYNEDTNTRLAILQSVERQLEQAKCQGGDAARTKLEKLLAAYRQLEKDTQALADSENNNNNNGSGADASFDIPNGWKNTAGGRGDQSKYWNQQNKFGPMVDVAINTTVAAFALDKTRVSCMQFSASGVTNKGSVPGNHYKTLGIQGIEGGTTQDHHLGHDNNAVRRRDQARIFRWYYSKLAYLIDRLKSIPEGGGTLFDSTLIVTASEFGMYNHRKNDIPYIVATGSNFNNVRKGQYVNVSNGNNFRNSADFLTGVAQALGTGINKVGSSGNAYKI